MSTVFCFNGDGVCVGYASDGGFAPREGCSIVESEMNYSGGLSEVLLVNGKIVLGGIPFTIPSSGETVRVAFKPEDKTEFQIAQQALQNPAALSYMIEFSSGDSGRFRKEDLEDLYAFSLQYGVRSGKVEFVDLYQGLNTLTKTALARGSDQYPNIESADVKRGLVAESNHADLFSAEDMRTEANLVARIIDVRNEHGDFTKNENP